MRYSHQRERIFRAVSERCDHPTANMVYEQLKVEMPRLSLGTVYRNLNQLGGSRKSPLRTVVAGSTRQKRRTPTSSATNAAR
jgi:hypothetical protein